jgi:hypothetical protein
MQHLQQRRNSRQVQPQEWSCSLSLGSTSNWLHWAWDIVNSDSYYATLAKLKQKIKGKRPGLLTDGIFLLHNNAHPHLTLPVIFHRLMIVPEIGDSMLYVQVFHQVMARLFWHNITGQARNGL